MNHGQSDGEVAFPTVQRRQVGFLSQLFQGGEGLGLHHAVQIHAHKASGTFFPVPRNSVAAPDAMKIKNMASHNISD